MLFISYYRIENAEVSVGLGCPPPQSSFVSGNERKSFQFHFHDYPKLSTTKDHFVASPTFIFNGHRWELRVYPGGTNEAAEGQVSVCLHYLSEGSITTRYGIKVIDKFGGSMKAKSSLQRRNFGGDTKSYGWSDFISRSDILDESINILDSDGTLTVAVSIEEELTDFVPQNPFPKTMKDMFNNEATADVCFEVSGVDAKEGTNENKSFYAHRWILEHCAPMLADICRSNDSGLVTALVDNVKPDVFHHLLSYVYGGSIPEEELEAHAKDIIDAADKHSIVSLKLEAEAAYVQSVDITFDNAMDNLLYADSMNCALLKEAVMTFLADNHREAAENISFTDDCPGHLMNDLLIAFSRNSNKDANIDDLTTLSVSELRRKLDSMGLEVDGSREAMIESIKNNS